MRITALALLLTVVMVSLAAAAPDHTPRTATVSRDAILRRKPSSSSGTVSHLASGTRLILLAPQPRMNYYHVRTAQGDEGWIWSHNIHIVWPPRKIVS